MLPPVRLPGSSPRYVASNVAPSTSLGSLLQQSLNPLVPPAEQRSGLGAEHLLEQRGIHRAEVEAGTEIAVVEVGQAGLGPVEPAVHPAPEDEHRTGGPVVGSVAGVRRDPPAELGVDGR